MKVEARRDDGAVLVTDGPAAVVVLEGRAWVTSRDSALARGNWEPDSGPVPEAAGLKADELHAFRAGLDDQQSRTISS